MNKLVKIEGNSKTGYVVELFGYRDKLVVSMGFKSKAAAKRAEKALLEMTWLVSQ